MATHVGKLNYNQKKIIGRGSYGTIVFQGFVLGLYEKDRPAAVKRYQRSHVNESLFNWEVELMKKASDHPNILRYIRTERDANFLYAVILFLLN